MANPYDKYLNRLQSKISQDPYYQQARRTAFATMPQQNSFGAYLNRENVPVGVASQMELDKQAQRQKSLTGVVERAGELDVQRKEQISDKIAEIKLKRDEYAKQKKDALTRTLFEAGGAAVGAVAGTVAAVGPLAGSQMGASAGQIIGGIQGDTPEDITAGLGNAIQTFSQISTNKSLKKLGASTGKAAEILSGIEDPAQRQAFLMEFNVLRTTGNYDGIDDLIGKYQQSGGGSWL